MSYVTQRLALPLAVSIPLALLACGGSPALQPTAGMVQPPPVAPAANTGAAAAPPASAHADALVASRAQPCGGAKLKVHFYNVAQALSALVDLPDGRHILVDTGDTAKRPGCGQVCSDAHQSLVAKLRSDLGGQPIDLIWITHQHSDHIG